ncbi:MAG: hypothetical protein Kow0069_01930 [Promethearchaeota archaeon]
MKMVGKRKRKDPLKDLEDASDLAEETDPDVLFAEGPGDEEASYISTCKRCGATVTRAEYKCPKCGRLLI